MFERLKEVDTKVYDRLCELVEDVGWIIILILGVIICFLAGKDE